MLKLCTGKEDEAGSEPLGERVVIGLLTGLECVVCISTTFALAFASVSIKWVLATVVLFG